MTRARNKNYRREEFLKTAAAVIFFVILAAVLIGSAIWQFTMWQHCNEIGGVYLSGKNIWPACIGGDR